MCGAGGERAPLEIFTLTDLFAPSSRCFPLGATHSYSSGTFACCGTAVNHLDVGSEWPVNEIVELGKFRFVTAYGMLTIMSGNIVICWYQRAPLPSMKVW